jgi:soluble lytic murein transglycosylase-like protein
VLLAAASYNGSPEHVSGWLRDFGHLEPELFVERIPFKETRDYVKKVLPTMAVYRALGGEPLLLDLPDAPLGPPPAKLTGFPPIPADE